MTEQRSLRSRGVVVVLVVLLTVALTVAPAVAKKKPKACKLLKPAQVESVLGAEITSAGEVGTADLSCSFDVGAGLGEPGGALLTVQYYKGVLARNIYSAISETAEEVGGARFLWDDASEIAYGYKKGKLAAVSVTYTASAVTGDELKDMVVQLAKLATKRL